MNKLEVIRSFQEAQWPRKNKKKPVGIIGLRSEGSLSEGNESPRWIDERGVAQITGAALSTLRNWRHRGTGFPYYKGPGGRMVRYLYDDVIRVMNEGKVNPRE